mgnify:FL=1
MHSVVKIKDLHSLRPYIFKILVYLNIDLSLKLITVELDILIAL